jgi:hypothetical protein
MVSQILAGYDRGGNSLGAGGAGGTGGRLERGETLWCYLSTHSVMVS